MRPKAQVGHMDLNKLAQIEENGSENLNIGLWCDLLVQWRLLYFVMNRIGTLSLSLSLNNRRIRIRYFMPPTYKLSPPTSKSQKTERFTYVREYNCMRTIGNEKNHVYTNDTKKKKKVIEEVTS